MRTAGDHNSMEHAPLATLFALERTIAQRRAEAEAGTAPGARCARPAASMLRPLDGLSVQCCAGAALAAAGAAVGTFPPTPRCCRVRAGGKPSWTAKLLGDPELLCRKVREEAGELCQTLEADEGRERAASEAADLFYHAMVLLNKQVRARASGWVGGHVGWREKTGLDARQHSCVHEAARQQPVASARCSPHR